MYPANLSSDNTIPFVQDDGGMYFLLVSPPTVVDKVLELAAPRPGEVLYDLGSGDGRIILEAARRYGARAVGLERNTDLFEHTQKRVRELGLADAVSVRCEDFAEVDLAEADVTVLYVDGPDVARVEARLRQRLAEGARVVAIADGLPGWQPTRREIVRDADDNEYEVYLYCKG